VADLRTGPKQPRSTVLTVEQEAIIVAFRRQLRLAETSPKLEDGVEVFCTGIWGRRFALSRECPTHAAMRLRHEWGTRCGGGLSVWATRPLWMFIFLVGKWFGLWWMGD